MGGITIEGGDPSTYKDNVWAHGNYGLVATGTTPGLPTLTRYAPNAIWSNNTFVGTANGTYPAGTNWVSSESAAPLASQIRSLVSSAPAGVVTP